MDKQAEKYIYPSVKIELYKYPESKLLVMFTKLRLKYRGKYYLIEFKKSWTIDLYVGGMALLEFTNHFHSEIYRHLKLMKVNLKIVLLSNNGTVKRMFQMDPDQTPEEERINK